MTDCADKYDCEQMLLECGLSTSKAKQLASSLKAAIKRQDEKIKETCSCREKPKLTVKKTENKDVNEIIDLRRKDKKEI